ncbi:MAG: hypothetical protein JRE57_00235 [Deltaproteobacteria bacterium]|nr:hypothetical protein [Deltaproteobacteria bacterium]
MAAKATEVKFADSAKSMGEFRCKSFNMFEPEDMVTYGDLRTNANNASSGINIEQIREYTRKTVIREGGPEGIVTTQEDVYLVVHYWEKPPKRTKGESDEDEQKQRDLQSVSSGS